MKIIHTSDIHLGSPQSTRLSPVKIRERKRELFEGFERIISEGRRIGARAFIIAGDLFDSESVTGRLIDSTLAAIEGGAPLEFFYLAGNHEGDALVSSGRALPKNLHIFGEDWTYFDLDGVTFAGRSECSEDMFDTLELSPMKKNIVVLHGELRDRSAAPEAIGKRDASGRNIDYLALGHYHSYSASEIDRRATAVYSGTPEGRGFDEIGECGFVIIDTEERPVSHKFVKSAKRAVRITKLDITGARHTGEVEYRAAAKLADISSEDLVRLELIGAYKPEVSYDTEALERKFSSRFYHFEVKDSSRMEIDKEDYKNDKTLKGEFIRMVMADDSLSTEERDRIISCGLHALMGEAVYDR